MGVRLYCSLLHSLEMGSAIESERPRDSSSSALHSAGTADTGFYSAFYMAGRIQTWILMPAQRFIL